MKLQNSIDARVPEPSADVLDTIRRTVQQACPHDELRIVAEGQRRTECINCGLTR